MFHKHFPSKYRYKETADRKFVVSFRSDHSNENERRLQKDRYNGRKKFDVVPKLNAFRVTTLNQANVNGRTIRLSIYQAGRCETN